MAAGLLEQKVRRMKGVVPRDRKRRQQVMSQMDHASLYGREAAPAALARQQLGPQSKDRIGLQEQLLPWLAWGLLHILAASEAAASPDN